MTHELCPTCKAKLEGRWESLNAGLCKSLIKFYEVAGDSKSVHLQKDCAFTKTEYNNFSKLKFFSLVTNKGEKAGYWRLTSHGKKFVETSVFAPKKVFVFRNEVKAKSEESISITKALKSRPFWLKREDYAAQSAPAATLF